MLSTDTQVDDDEADKPVRLAKRTVDQLTPPQKVTISTVHSAKGLEWPVVFIPASKFDQSPQADISVEDSTFPSWRCIEEHEIAEERRLLYVAMTRAQTFLVSCSSDLPS